MSLSSTIRHLFGIPEMPPAPDRKCAAHSDEARGQVRQALARNAAVHRQFASETTKARLDSATGLIAVSELVDFMTAKRPKDTDEAAH